RPGGGRHLRHRRRGDGRWRDGVRRDQRVQPGQRVRPHLKAAFDSHTRRARRRARRRDVYGHCRGDCQHLAADLGGRGLLRGPCNRPLPQAQWPVRQEGGAGAVTTARVWQWSGSLLLLAAAAVFPLAFTNPAITNYGVYTLIFVAAASAWNIFSGYSGYISLGHAVFFGSGAYFTGIATRDWHYTGSQVFALLPLAGLVGAILAVPFGLLALQVRRHTFVVMTIAVFFIFQLMAYNLATTGGTSGLLAPTINYNAATY